MGSLFHFFNDLISKRQDFFTVQKLEQFPFDDMMLSCRQKGRFPDMAIKINRDYANTPNTLLKGGELVELKDSQSYTIPSFNSTIPTGQKRIVDLVRRGTLGDIMSASGDNVHSLPIREVYYLLRGRLKDTVKVCLLHGSFFETVKANDLLSTAFQQVLHNVGESEQTYDPEVHYKQSDFASVKRVKGASVTLRFRVMTEACSEANILKNYESIRDNTINLIIPLHTNTADEKQQIDEAVTFSGMSRYDIHTCEIKHPLNGYFWVASHSLK